MRRLLILLGAALITVGLTTTALAISVHWKKGSPTFVDNGLTLTESGTLAGLGGGAGADIRLNATAIPVATCSNPSAKDGKDQQPAGQNPAPVTVGSSTLHISPDGIDHNGNATYTITTNPPTSPIAGAPDCPGSSWTETITDLKFTSATLLVAQPDFATGVTVFQAPKSTCTFSPATANGSVPSSTVTCP